MSLLSYIVPQTILHTSSLYHKDIRVLEVNGKRRLVANGILQTGPYVQTIFDTGFSLFHIKELHKINKILILGVGGGYMIQKMKNYFPDASITGIDIDKKIIDIAKTYFISDISPDVTYIAEDAKKYIYSTSKNLDFICIDLYIGDDLPVFLQSKVFYSKIAQHLFKNGHVFINYQGTSRYKDNVKDLKKFLPDLYSTVDVVTVERNTFFYLKK